MAVMVVSSVLFFALFSCSTGLQWSSGPRQHAIVYACSGGNLSLPWTLNVGPGDTVENIQWFYAGRSQELVATVAHGNFLPMPTFARRVQQTTNAGMDIERVEVMDSGNYSVEVIGRTAGGDTVTLLRSALVYVTDGLQTSDGSLYVVQLPVAEYNKESDQYHVALRCDTFTYPTHPPFEVTWTTPSGLTLASSGYQNGSYRLMLPNPVEGGSYVCHIPPAPACLHGNTGEATLVVDKMEAHLLILEAQVSDLKNKNRVLENRDTTLETQLSALKNRVNVLETKNKALEDLSRQQVSFHVRMPANQHLSSGLHLIMSDVVYNQGNAYDPTSGIFTAPFSGSYCFLVSSATWASGYVANVQLMVDNGSVAFVYVLNDHEYEAGSGQAVVPLTAGHTVWLKSSGDSYYYNLSTAFSGFLIHPDF